MQAAVVNIAAREVVAVVGDLSAVLPLGQAYYRYEEWHPAFDDATHREEFSHDEITGAKVIRHFAAIALTDDEIFDRMLRLGYVDAETGIKLKTTERATMLFSQLASQLTLGLSIGQTQAADTRNITDFFDAEHELTVSNLCQLLYRYGVYCEQLRHDYAP